MRFLKEWLLEQGAPPKEMGQEDIDTKNNIVSKDMGASELYKFNRLPYKEKVKIIDEFIDTHPNKSNLKNGKVFYRYAILDKGFDSEENDILEFMSNIKRNLSYNIVELFYNLIKKDKIDTSEKWLYDNTLYNEGEDETLYKIKALAYASDERSQSTASKEITVDDLKDDLGKLMSAKEMKNVLKSITVEKKKSKYDKEDAEKSIKDEESEDTKREKLRAIKALTNTSLLNYSQKKATEAVDKAYEKDMSWKELVNVISGTNMKDLSDDFFD